MYALLSILDRVRENVCIIINGGQGERKYKMYVLLSMVDRERQNTKYMSYYQCWTGRNKIQNVCIIINVGQGDTKYKMHVLLSMSDRE